jgi:hypothetical protein
MRAWTNRTELPSDRRFDHATSNRSEAMLEHDKRIMAQVTGRMHAGSVNSRRPIVINSPKGAATSSLSGGLWSSVLYAMRRVDCRRCQAVRRGSPLGQRQAAAAAGPHPGLAPAAACRRRAPVASRPGVGGGSRGPARAARRPRERGRRGHRRRGVAHRLGCWPISAKLNQDERFLRWSQFRAGRTHLSPQPDAFGADRRNVPALPHLQS